MRIRQLQLRPFRNFAGLELDLGAQGALIVGDNGRGKSNILEAISYLSLGKSIRGARDQEAVPHDGEWFDIRGLWDEGGDRQRQARVFYSAQEGKRVFLDGAPLPKVSDLVSQFHTVHFAPEDVALVLQFSAQRRRLLDILISQASTAYLQALQRYGRVLTQRNHFLRQLGQRRADPAERQVWDGQLAEPGAQIRRARLETLVEISPILDACYAGFSTGRESAGIEYRDAPLPEAGALPGEEALRDEFLAELTADPGREERAGHTLSGPHRDAFGFTLDGESAETYGSQGQLKSILLSWKMAESRYLEARSGRQPVLLFDDVFSELDEQRSHQLLSLAEEFEQVILTAPRAPADDLPARYERIELAAA